VSAASARAAAGRDARLDLARGLTMLIIFVAHVPANPWADFIPARMGFSSGAEAFVLCSGVACGIAFGGTYQRQGWLGGTRRIARRIAQLWGAQVLAFLGFAAALLAVDAVLGSDVYRLRYSLGYLADQPFAAIANLALLRYVPIYFDILPLYILLLAAVPVMIWVAGRSKAAALTLSGALWLAVQIWPLNLSAHPVEARPWYFDPFAWQFLFFLGFGASAGWLTVPRPTPARIVAAALLIVACIPLTFWPFHQLWPALREIFVAIYPGEAITTLHPLRLVHVLVLGWLFAALLAPRKAELAAGALRPVIIIGQQSLTTFLTGIILSALAGVALDLASRGALPVAAANIAGFAALVLAAHLARHVKNRLKSRPTPTKEPLACATHT
jgi:hypothetical protein